MVSQGCDRDEDADLRVNDASCSTTCTRGALSRGDTAFRETYVVGIQVVQVDVTAAIIEVTSLCSKLNRYGWRKIEGFHDGHLELRERDLLPIARQNP